MLFFLVLEKRSHWRLSALLQARQREEAELKRQAERLRKLEAKQRLKEEADVKALSQQLLAHQVMTVLTACISCVQVVYPQNLPPCMLLLLLSKP